MVGLTCAVQMGVDGPMSGARAGGSGVAVLGFGGAHTEAPYLAVRTVHHLHKLPTPMKEEENDYGQWSALYTTIVYFMLHVLSFTWTYMHRCCRLPFNMSNSGC